MKLDQLWKPFIVIGLVLANTCSAGAEVKFIPMLDASLALNSAKYDAEYSNPQVKTDQQSTGQNSYIYFAPNIGFSEIPNLWITPIMEFEYTGANNLLNLEDEAFVFSKRLDFYYLLGINYAFNPVWGMKLKGFGRLEKAAETADETLETGLYNYRDAGGWGEVDAKYQLGILMRTKLGYKSYLRRYPNYSPLIKEYDTNVTPLPPNSQINDNEKDTNIHESWLRQELSWGSLPLLTNTELHFKMVDYTGMHKQLLDGTYSSDLRQDAYLDFYLELPYFINKYHQLEFDYNYRLRYSNTGYYNTSNAYFLDGYYNYNQNQINLLYNFKLWFEITGFLPRGSVSLAWQNRRYYSRPSLQKVETDGSSGAEYKFDDPHWESTFDFGITLKQQLWADWFNLFVSLHSITQTSNSTVEDSASYNYKFNTFTLGTAVSF